MADCDEEHCVGLNMLDSLLAFDKPVDGHGVSGQALIEKFVLPKLSWNDLLRFRRTSKAVHRITTRYMREHPEMAPELVIEEEGDRDFDEFMKMGIPSTKIFLNNVSGDAFYEYGGFFMGLFAAKYGKLVTSLRVRKISYYLQGEENLFLDKLTNVRKFEAGGFAEGEQDIVRWNLTTQTDKGEEHRATVTGFSFPESFRNLESITIGQAFPEDNVFFRSIILLETLLKQVKYVSLPFSPYNTYDLVPGIQALFHDRNVEFSVQSYVIQYSLAYAFVLIGRFVQFRNLHCMGLPNVEIFDFAAYRDKHKVIMQCATRFTSYSFYKLCEICCVHDVKLQNVDAEWLSYKLYEPQMICPGSGAAIASVIGLHAGMLSLEMPNLECLIIKRTSACELPIKLDQEPHATWKALKRLDITVNEENSATYQVAGFKIFNLQDIYSFFFKDKLRWLLTDLRLNFTDNSRPMPKCDYIVSSCPNLKKLTLVNWLGTNKSLFKLWEGLRSLEDITLENCRSVGNVTFVGTNKKDPLFLKLKNLKKLSLLGLDRMPKITDLLFTMVLCHLPLSHFIITSRKPIESVTLSGIECLQEGEFADSIEKFPFKDWKLAGVADEDFKELETKFRSYDMI